MATHNLEEIRDAMRVLAELNEDDLGSLSIVDWGFDVPIPAQEIEDWKHVGLTNLEFLKSHGYVR